MTDCRSLGWPAPGKLNLFLHVLGRRADGYHPLQTLFQFIDLADGLDFELRRDGVIRCEITGLDLPETANLAYRAAQLLKLSSASGFGVDIRIRKRIPVGAGLGGGSSDAATTLLALDRLWNLRRSRADLARIGLALGADVPVFIHGRAAWAEGIGDDLTPYAPEEGWYALAVPAVAVSTTRVFADLALTRSLPPMTISDFLEGRVGNDLEAPARRLYPEVGRCLDWLARRAPARMTGSGGGVFARAASAVAARSLLEGLPEGCAGFVVRGLNRHPIEERLASVP